MKHGRRKRHNPKTLEKASEWLSTLEHDRLLSYPAFAFWILRSPAHIRAFIHVAAFDVELARFCSRIRSDFEVVPTPRRWLRVLLLGSAAVATATVAAVTVSSVVWHSSDRAAPATGEYVAGIGEQSQFQLADGSTVHLNTASHLRVSLTRNTRDIYLVSGEALFTVARDTARPFRVHTDTAVVKAVGTQFNVDAHRELVVVAVLEGQVQLELPGQRGSGAPEGIASLRAGQIAEARRDSSGARLHITTPSTANVERRVRWTTGVLEFDGEPLTEVVAQVNRYNRQQLVIDSPELGELRIGGRFKANDLRAFVSGLQKIASIEAHWPGSNSVLPEPIVLAARPIQPAISQ